METCFQELWQEQADSLDVRARGDAEAARRSRLKSLQWRQARAKSVAKKQVEQPFEDTSRIDKSLWQVTLEVLREEVCGDEGFRSQVLDYNKNPGSASLLTGAIVYLVGLTALPIDPAIATIVVLYILKVGLNIFCAYTEPPNSDGLTRP